MSKKAIMVYHHKAEIRSKYVLELTIWEIDDLDKFPDKIKYSLIFTESENLTNKILFDNHHPKGHHYHINNEQYLYEFKNIEELINDFQQLVFEHFGVKL